MTSNATKIAAGTSLLGVGGLVGVLLAPQPDGGERAAATVQTAAPVVRTVHIKRVHHRTIHEKPKAQHVHAAAAPAAAAAVAPSPVRQVVAAPAPAPAQHPLRTRSSGGGTGSGENEHEHEGGDD
jgi:hypothetical protein